MTKERIAEILARAEKTVPGPWRAQDCGPNSPAFVEIDTGTGEEGNLIAETFTGGFCTPFDNADFIAHARQDILDLIVYIQELEAR